MRRAQDVLDYWFGTPDHPEYGLPRKIWFEDGRTIDAELRERFLALHEEAASGALDAWRGDRTACLALVILLDQFPRHMFRDDGRAYATDPKAQATATHAVDAGYDRDRMIVEKNFFYLPFTHAEDMAAQTRSVALRRAMPDHDNKPRAIQRAEEHRDVIDQFGRFPHRNDIIGRPSTAEELAFLEADPEAWFMKYRKRSA